MASRLHKSRCFSCTSHGKMQMLEQYKMFNVCLSEGAFTLKVQNNLTSLFCEICKTWLNYLPAMSKWVFLSDYKCPIAVERCRTCAIWLHWGEWGGKDESGHLGQSVGKTPAQEVLHCGSMKSHHLKGERPGFIVRLEMKPLVRPGL